VPPDFPGPNTPGSEHYHLVVSALSPALDSGRYAIKRIVGDELVVGADVLCDTLDVVSARIAFRRPLLQSSGDWEFASLAYDQATDRWNGTIILDTIGHWVFTVEAWTDEFATWQRAIRAKISAGQDVTLELAEGAAMLVQVQEREMEHHQRALLQRARMQLASVDADTNTRAELALSEPVHALAARLLPQKHFTRWEPVLPVRVERVRAGFAAWYEMFPRSCGPNEHTHGTFRNAELALARIAKLGFDVVYVPPIHPVGVRARKGRNNAPLAGPDDPGSPWAIGNEHGGHTAVDPRLGTIREFEHFVAHARNLGLEIALDYALQCSPDHPWLRDHPDWFFVRHDGSIQYAENPPKKYQDIYPLNFWCKDRVQLWQACRDIIEFWIDRGVSIYRVDNPHTKPFSFWEWLIRNIHADHPHVIFLAEAFTRPKPMLELAKLGFSQSYTYFTWRNTASELATYLEQLTTCPIVDFMRGNLFVNTPDILHEYLQTGGRPAFCVRLLLAATLSPLYGVYSGFELCENMPVHPGSEEYLDSEKYQLRHRVWDASGNIQREIAAINHIRRSYPALQRNDNLAFHVADDQHILVYSKLGPDGQDLLAVVNLDPLAAHETMVHVPLERLNLGPDRPFTVEDLLTGERWVWRGSLNYVRLDPNERIGHLLRIVRE